MKNSANSLVPPKVKIPLTRNRLKKWIEKFPFWKTSLQIFKYFWVSVVAAIADFSSFILLSELTNTQCIISNIIAFIVGVSVNYSLSVRFVFKGESSQSMREFIVFSIIGLFGLGISCAVLYITIDILGISKSFSKICSIGATFFWNFSIRKLLLFREK